MENSCGARPPTVKAAELEFGETKHWICPVPIVYVEV